MRLREDHIKRIAKLVMKKFKQTGVVKFLKSEHDVEQKIADVIFKNMMAEEQLDEEAQKTLEKYRAQAPADFDERKMLMMIKKQLAKDRGFVL